MVGKFHKNYTIQKIEDQQTFHELLKKLPEGTTLVNSHSPNENSVQLWKSRFDYPESEISIQYHMVMPGDTTSVFWKGELVGWNQKEDFENLIPYALLKTDYVTNREWNLYQYYVSDSIFRMLMSENQGGDFYSKGRIKTYDDYGVEHDDNEWGINWKFDAKGKTKKEPRNYKGAWAEMNYPPHEQFNYKEQYDIRKQVYSYVKESDFFERTNNYMTHTFADSLEWINTDNYHYGCLEEQLASFYHHHEHFSDYPACNLNSEQVAGFLHWKEKFHQLWLDQKGIALEVKYHLPSKFELDGHDAQPRNVIVPRFELSKWLITNAEYKEFIDYVRDSIAIRILAEETGEESYLTPTFDSDGEETDQGEWNLNWDKRPDFQNLTAEERDILSYLFYPPYFKLGDRIDERKLMYRYYVEDLGHAKKTRTFKDTLTTEDEKNLKQLGIEYYVKYTGGKHEVIKPRWWNYSSMGYYYRSWYGNRLMSIAYPDDRSTSIHRFIEWADPGINRPFFEELKLSDENGFLDLKTYKYPFDEEKPLPLYDYDSQPNAAANINYAQATAYYHWKKRVKGAVEENTNLLIANYVPSEKEWEKLQNGEQLIKKEQIYPLPTPAFRYAIHYYPKDIVNQNRISFVKFVMGGDQKLFQKGDKYAIHNGYDEWICDFDYDSIEYTNEDDLYLVEKDGKYGKMDYKGDIIIPIQYEAIKHISGKMYEVKENGIKKEIGGDQ